MTDSVPPGRRIDRAALERIIHRAAELQASEREIGEGLTEPEVLALGEEVGIPAHHLRRALVEEETRSLTTAKRGMLAWLAGPTRVAAERTLDDEPDVVDDALQHWMTEGELLTIKRRFSGSMSWEPQRGAVATIKRSFRSGGRKYVLARAREIVSQVIGLGHGRAHVRLMADMANSRKEHLGGAGALATAGAGATAVALVLGVALPIALLPIPLGGVLAFSVSRSHLSDIEQMQVALEQVLDKLQYGEISVPDEVGPQRSNPFLRIAEEIRRQIRG